MKKIISMILIMVFCTCQYGWAVEIIVGSDGQAKYADELLNISESGTLAQNAKQKDVFNEVTITDDSGKTETIYIDDKGNVKKVEEGQISKLQKVTTDKIKEENYKQIIKKAPRVLYNSDSILSHYGYSKKDNSAKSKKEYMKISLLDGDYAIGFKDVPYIAEYHKDKKIMGLAKLEKIVLNDQKASIVFYEYRVGYNTSTGMGLKHILFLDFEKGKYISQYIYNVDGKLLCRQINNDIYVAQDARNMLPDWQKRSVQKARIKYKSKKQKRSFSIDIDTDELLCRIIGLPLFIAGIPLLVIPPVGIICLFYGGIMFFDGGHFNHY